MTRDQADGVAVIVGMLLIVAGVWLAVGLACALVVVGAFLLFLALR